MYAPRYKTGSRRNPTGGQNKDAATEAFKAWFEQQDPWDITVFSDRSQTKEGLGYGYVVFEGQEKIAEGQGGMDKCGVVFDAEALGALRGLQKAVELAPKSAITICADNTAAIWSVQKDAPTTSQWVFIKIHELMDRHNMSIKWSPGHKEIQGNEMADELAKSGALHGPKDPDSRPTAAGLKSWAKSMIRDMANNWWAKARYSSGITNAEILYKPGKCPKVLEIPRAHLGWYMQTITAHGDYAWYHRRFEHEDAELHCPCSYSDYSRIARSVQHMTRRNPVGGLELADEAAQPPAELRLEQPNRSILVMASPEPPKFSEWCSTTEYFTKLCPPSKGKHLCCRVRWGTPAEATPDPLDEELEALEIVAPGAA
ncbi:hypothetical protein PG995_005352 [Apiospora arundinis]